MWSQKSRWPLILPVILYFLGPFTMALSQNLRLRCSRNTVFSPQSVLQSSLLLQPQWTVIMSYSSSYTLPISLILHLSSLTSNFLEPTVCSTWSISSIWPFLTSTVGPGLHHHHLSPILLQLPANTSPYWCLLFNLFSHKRPVVLKYFVVSIHCHSL